ncbi:MAG: cobalt-precorrin-7 (C(5))-methyltransferase [Methanosarcinales archaeon]|nr:cobalt-precorrin-7 (C(5))-methyltransferase [Methanosarcinales archaeon]
MKVVGVGAGPGMLTREAMDAVRGASLIYGSRRSIELVQEHIPPGCTVKVIEDYKALRTLPGEAVVLSTGDPMLSGLGYLEAEIVPGISSMQVACARLRISQLRVVPITFHGRRMDPEAVAFELSRGRFVFLLTDDSTDMAGLCSYLESRGLRREVAVMTDLGYPQERIVLKSTSDPPLAVGLSCVMIGELSPRR